MMTLMPTPVLSCVMSRLSLLIMFFVHIRTTADSIYRAVEMAPRFSVTNGVASRAPMSFADAVSSSSAPGPPPVLDSKALKKLKKVAASGSESGLPLLGSSSTQSLADTTAIGQPVDSSSLISIQIVHWQYRKARAN